MLDYVRRDWLRLLVAAPGSLSSGVPVRLGVFILVALLIALANAEGYALQVPASVHEFGGAVLTLVFAFRTNTAYARFWEGRTLWGTLVNASRSFVRIVAAGAPGEPKRVAALRRKTALFAHATRHHLRKEELSSELHGLWQDGMPFVELASHHHPALAVAEAMSREVRALVSEGVLDPLVGVEAEREIVRLVDCLGGCERIANTPTPFGYILLIQRFVAVFLATLPLAMVSKVGWYTPVVTLAVAYPALMIEALGSELDDPFGHDPHDLPLTTICDKIERDVTGDVQLPGQRRRDAVVHYD